MYNYIHHIIQFATGVGEVEGCQNSWCRSKVSSCLYAPAVHWKIKWVHQLPVSYCTFLQQSLYSVALRLNPKKNLLSLIQETTFQGAQWDSTTVQATSSPVRVETITIVTQKQRLSSLVAPSASHKGCMHFWLRVSHWGHVAIDKIFWWTLLLYCLEMLAVLLPILPDLRVYHVFVWSDNILVVSYIRYKLPRQSKSTVQVDAAYLALGSGQTTLTERKVHILGHLNVKADFLLRQGLRPGEWRL